MRAGANSGPSLPSAANDNPDFAHFKAPASLLICGQKGSMQHVAAAAVLHRLERLPLICLGLADLLTAGGV